MLTEPQKFTIKSTFSNALKINKRDGPLQEHCGIKWFIHLNHPRTSDYLEVFLYRATPENEAPPITVSFEAIIISKNGTETIKNEEEYKFDKVYGWGWTNFAKWSEVKSNYIVNNQLTVEIRVEVKRDPIVVKNDNEFNISHKIPPQLTFDSSSIETHFDTPWKLCIAREGSYLEVKINCEKEKRSNLWSIDTEITFKIKTKDGKTVEKVEDFCCDQKNKTHNWVKLVEIDSIEDGSNVEARVKVKRMIGINQKRKIGFDGEDYQELADVCLKVDDKQFHVNKVFLARFSSVFKSMFFGETADSNLKEVVIEDTDVLTFESFISIIYLQKCAIDLNNVENLLVLADKYDVPKVTEKCVKFLIKKDIDVARKLELSEQFHLSDVQEHVLKTLKTLQDVKKLNSSMNRMGTATKDALFEKTMSLVS